MGIDVYMRWKGQTEEERKEQITGFSLAHGHVGYLREAYHGEPYATRVLVPEAFEDEALALDEEQYMVGAPIPASVLRERLPAAIAAAIRREREIYKRKAGPGSRTVKAFENFVRLAEKKEKETGEPVKIAASW
jgi:hypothetical protein